MDSIAEATGKRGITRRCVQALCSEGRIPGLEMPEKAWALPRDAKKRKICEESVIADSNTDML